MKKFRFISLAMIMLLVGGCSCSKINDSTYENAVNLFKGSDALSFSRIEIISSEGEDTYTRKRIDAKYTFNTNKTVTNMEYTITYAQGSTGGGSTSVSQTLKYYYSGERNTLYTYSKIGENLLERYKERDVSYDSKFNVNTCQNNDCSLMIASNLVPIFTLDSVNEFSISDDNGVGVASFKAICPSFESCASNSQMLDYRVTINKDGNIDSLAYEIDNNGTNYSIRYTFNGYGSSDVVVEFPSDLESYIEK